MEKERGEPCKKAGRKNGQELIATSPDSIKEARTSSMKMQELVRAFLMRDSSAALTKPTLLSRVINVSPQNAFSESLPDYGFQPAPLKYFRPSLPPHNEGYR